MWGMTRDRWSRRGELVRSGSATTLVVLALTTLASIGYVVGDIDK